MKKYKIFGFIAFFLVLSVGLFSCLTDEKVENQEYGIINLTANKIIELPSDASHIVSKTLLPEGVVDVNLGEVRLAAEGVASEDIVVTLTTSKSAAMNPGQLLFPLDKVVVPSTLTIPKGQRSVPLVAKVNTGFLIPDPQYMSISIASVDKQGYIISGNYGNINVNFKLRHRYEGKYVLTGVMDHLPSIGAYVHISNFFAPDPYICRLETNDGESLIFFEEQGFNDYTYPMMTAAGGFSGWGSFCPIFYFDAQGNITKVENAYGQPASNTRSAKLDPSGVNKYDQATKSFQVSYWMAQPSVVPTPPSYRCHMVEKYTFLKNL